MSITHPDVSPQKRERLLSPQEVSDWTGLTTGNLAQLRYAGGGPKYLAPTPRTIRYRESDVQAWLDASERTSTARAS